MSTRKLQSKSAARGVMLSTILFGLTTGILPALAADEPVAEPVESYYTNPAQAAHAAQLAEQVAMTNDQQVEETQLAVDKAEEDVAAAQEELTAAQEAFNAAQADLDALLVADPNIDPNSLEYLDAVSARDDAQAALENEQQQYDTEQTRLEALEDTLTDLLAYDAGVTAAEIEQMRRDGLGWGQIAHELGVHPSALGLGHSKNARTRNTETVMTAAEIEGIDAQELAENSVRKSGNGPAKGQSKGIKAQIHEPGTGLTVDSTTAASTGAGSKSNGNSNSGDNDGNGKSGNANGSGNNGGDDKGGGNGKSGGNDKGNSGGNDKGNSGGNGKGGGNDKGNSGGKD